MSWTWVPKIIVDSIPEFIAGVVSAAFLGALAWLYSRGSWTRGHKRARMYEEQGDRFFQQSQWHSAMQLYEMALRIWDDEVNQANMLRLHHKIGKTHSARGNSADALQSLCICEGLWKGIKTDAKIQEIYYELAQLYLGQNDLQNAATYINKTIELLRRQNSPRLPVALAMSARVSKSLGNYAGAESNYIEAANYLRDIGDTLGLASVQYELGDLKVLLNQPDQASLYYKRAADDYDKLGSKRAEEIRRSKLAPAA